MRAAVVEELGRIAVKEVKTPEPGPGSLLVRVESCAICGTDLRIFRKGDSRARYPVIIGHEISGIVERVARDVSGFSEGDRVCVAPGHGCGECVFCRRGHSNVCINPCPPIGYASSGGFAQYIVPPPNVVRNGFVNRIPENVCFDEASISELAACCLNAQENARIEKGDCVLIFGAGPAGCMHIELSRLNGARKVLITALHEDRLKLAERFKPDRSIVALGENLRGVVLEETDGLGVDVIFVCAPSKEAQEKAFELLAPRGRINFFGGLPRDNRHITIDANQIHDKELFVSGASSSLSRLNVEALKLISERKISARDYITHTFPLDRIEEAFRVIESRQAIKVIVKPWE